MLAEYALKAHLWLCARFRRLRTKGKPIQVVVVAIARQIPAVA